MAEPLKWEIRPTMRMIRLGYVVAGVLVIAALVWWGKLQDHLSLAGVAAAGLLMVWPASRHVKRQRVCCRLDGENLRYQEGLLATTVKTIPLSGIQDITVSRTLGQRMWGVGDLRIETAGHASALTIRNIDSPQQCADRILGLRGRSASVTKRTGDQ